MSVTNSSRNVADATTNMSMAAMPIASLRKKAPPARRRRARSSHHVLADGGLTDLDTEFGQLAMDARCTPERLALLICRIRSRTSQLTDGRPDFDLQRQ
jgi:hypothetical protein